jgi:hypothetical protein
MTRVGVGKPLIWINRIRTPEQGDGEASMISVVRWHLIPLARRVAFIDSFAGTRAGQG